jgi:hypothetical protein
MEDEIEMTLAEIDKDLVEIKDAKKELNPLDNLKDMVLSSVTKVEKNTDLVFDHYLTEVLTRNDRSESTKNTLVEILRVKNESMGNITNIINALAKIEASKNQKAGSVLIQSKSASEVGINFSNML